MGSFLCHYPLIKQCSINLGCAENWTQGRWVRSENAIHCALRPPILRENLRSVLHQGGTDSLALPWSLAGVDKFSWNSSSFGSRMDPCHGFWRNRSLNFESIIGQKIADPKSEQGPSTNIVNHKNPKDAVMKSRNLDRLDVKAKEKKFHSEQKLHVYLIKLFKGI